ncbi:MAG: hypothetical protein ACOH1V_13465 [Stenotrophomonas sp.]
MRTYVRTQVKGGTYFFTVNLAERHGNTLLIDHIGALKAALQQTRNVYPFAMPGFMVRPEQLHCLSAGDDDFPMRWRLIKIPLLPKLAIGGTAFPQPGARERTRYLAASLLGARGPQRSGLPTLPGLHPLQPCQT